MKPLRILWLAPALLSLAGCLDTHPGVQHDDTTWHGAERSLRYHPEEGDFVIRNGTLRFNRALYGTHSGFRVEAGDLPEFALYLPGLGGNFKMGLMSGDISKWMIDAEEIEARYRPGSMLYEIRDPLLGRGVIRLTLLARASAEGMILRCETENIADGVSLFWAYGGASGKRFSRSGDIGADPESSFYLKPEYCLGNAYLVDGNSFSLQFESVRNGERMQMDGVIPSGNQIRLCDAGIQESPAALFSSEASDAPVIAGKYPAGESEQLYFMISRNRGDEPVRYEEIPGLFEQAEQARKDVAERISLSTPDPYINNVGSALAVAADAIWEEPSYLHGAVAWRMRLPGWRGAYAGDWLGWHDRARQHFEGYAKAQYQAPPEGPNAPDTATHLARQVEEPGHSLFTEGYISRSPNRINRPHHYDMNLVFVDQLLWHILWTGDMQFARQIWPVLRKHFDWEKRCFDGNGDGLYDAYAAIWASDALQYNGGGVTHSSAYNYRANLLAARIAEKLGEDPEPYREEAEKIRKAVNGMLWMPEKGCYAEYMDLLGLQRVHPSPGLWTVYHAIDAGISDPFQSWQSLRYVDTGIPHIPVKAENLPEGNYYTLSNTNWMPYTWSINNVALAENMHTALANWQAGRPEEAFNLWKSQILESMYLGSSPGNLQQLSFYDAFRGELYRDFADPIGITARTLVEGLFGVVPDALDGILTVRPGLPEAWDFATLETPELFLDYKRKGNREHYTIRNGFEVPMDLHLVLRARKSSLRSVTVNGREQQWKPVPDAVGLPAVAIEAGPGESHEVILEWSGRDPVIPEMPERISVNEPIEVNLPGTGIVSAYDPRHLLKDPEIEGNSFRAVISGDTGHHLIFLQAVQGDLTWWIPLEVEIRAPAELLISETDDAGNYGVQIRNNSKTAIKGDLYIHPESHPVHQGIHLPGRGISGTLPLPEDLLVPGSNRLVFQSGDQSAESLLVNWKVPEGSEPAYRTVDLSGYFNDRVTQIFRNRYLTPRSPYSTLQLPWQGIGDWASYSKTASIDDSGLRERAGEEGLIVLRQGIPLRTPGGPEEHNILFTALWDNYPDQAEVPLSGRASHAYLMMAGSTHHMQSRIANGEVVFAYADGSFEKLELINPETWWPIEQDYYTDDFAFHVPGTRPPRIHLKDGSEPSGPYQVLSRNRTNLIDGGAATLVDLPLDPAKELRSVTIRTLSNDVVIGLMSLTLIPAW